jgi:hypothetical protein
MKKLFIIATAILFSFCLSGVALAFHGGGVAHCDGCHSMHAGSGNSRFVSQGPSLTNGSDPSSTCLNCHNGAARYHVNSADGSNTNEGGDFHWTQDNGYTYYNRGLRAVNFNNKGHNMNAADYGLAGDSDLTAAPGGSFLSADLGCTSCHDPHGQKNGGTANGMAPISVSGSYGADPDPGTIAGNYRILYDSFKVGFSEDAPIARANSYDGASVQYGAGMSGWCANCHLGFYAQTSSGGMHPTDVAPPSTYNSYVATGNFTGAAASAYDPLVPIERGGVTASSELPDPTDQAAAGYGINGTGNEQVMCLTCHRAHASAFDNALRFDYTTSEFIAESWFTLENTAVCDDGFGGTWVDDDGVAGCSSGDTGYIGATNLPGATAAPYYKHGTAIDVANDPVAAWDGGYGHYQRSLCNKCHVKD